MSIHSSFQSTLSEGVRCLLSAPSSLLRRVVFGASLAVAAPAFAQANVDLAAVLRSVDALRSGTGALRVETEVTSIKHDGTTDKRRSFSVMLQPNRRVLIMARTPPDQGQKLLMLNDDFWIVLPTSQRPLRISATQKLVGDASTADIGTVRWADDYEPRLVGEEDCGTQRRCWRIELKALRPSTSYSRIDLWVGKDKSDPVKADMYLQSGKLAKSAQYVLDNPRSPTLVLETILTDELSNFKETRVRYLSRDAKDIAPNEWFNPVFLASNPDIK